MAKRAATTLIFSGSDQIVRMDFGPRASKTLLFSWLVGKLPGQSIGQAVEVALGAEARCGKDVWILCEDAWTQSLTLAAQAVAGLGDEQLERVLGFEMESLSGLSAADSIAGFVRGPQDAGVM